MYEFISHSVYCNALWLYIIFHGGEMNKVVAKQFFISTFVFLIAMVIHTAFLQNQKLQKSAEHKEIKNQVLNQQLINNKMHASR